VRQARPGSPHSAVDAAEEGVVSREGIMMPNILLGTLMMIVTTAIHSVFTIFSLRVLNRWLHRRHNVHSYNAIALIAGTILMFFAAALIEVGLWAGAYLAIGAVEGVETSIYYSMVTFTTLGYGDVVLSDRWRLLSSLEAANGIIMFGWTTAVVMAVVQRSFAKALRHSNRKDGAEVT
jgi:voltage-gated potassium channel Kch